MFIKKNLQISNDLLENYSIQIFIFFMKISIVSILNNKYKFYYILHNIFFIRKYHRINLVLKYIICLVIKKSILL